uniref:Uncharacterized protein n=1 Tax=viral metagenome TaxID=1070528 RepID=A0A6H2A5F9_9ZZZZ
MKTQKTKLSKKMLLKYLVDVLGHNIQEAQDEIRLYRTYELLTPEQFEECIAFNK